ncbi:hypothetical protein DY000_02038841 [Brassica cretica]|uniref:Arabidopsis retrotransposon Orf1 C-terminal domain-containing protein n=1 Tax=Brassica cretica TaxID=69181 RepID=A0ABQ7BAB7_BRACR|nr:hypothetical protein DY000_02038841 [Brassica cretica]
MPPRTKKSATRTRKTNNTPPQRAQQPTSASYSWPREQEDGPINLDDPMLLDFNCEGWDKETASRYNTLLKAEILPTHFCHAETLVELGIDEDVFETLQAMGIAPLCYATHELYPDLVRQVLATATISYEDFSAPSYANCSFSFMADGEYCSLSLDKLNKIYEIANEPRGVAVAKKFAPSNTFWDFIANGNFTPGKAYQSQIRNPALRVIAKIISNLLFAKDQTSKVTNGELQTLYAGIEDEIRASGSGIPIQKVKTNPGFHFITMLCERRLCLMHGTNKKDRSVILASNPIGFSSSFRFCSPFAPIITVEMVWFGELMFRCLHAPSNRPIEKKKTNNTPPQRAKQPTSASYPWPREQEDEPINLDDPMLLDFNCEGWDKETASRYNTLLKAEILPTHFCHAETLVELGIDEDVFETLQAMGIAPLCLEQVKE